MIKNLMIICNKNDKEDHRREVRDVFFESNDWFARLEKDYGIKKVLDTQLKIDNEMVYVIQDAAKKAITDLFQKHKEHFYYCSLIYDRRSSMPVHIGMVR